MGKSEAIGPKMRMNIKIGEYIDGRATVTQKRNIVLGIMLTFCLIIIQLDLQIF